MIDDEISNYEINRSLKDELNMKELKVPVSDADIRELRVGDKIEISGYILCGRDAVLPKIVEMIDNDKISDLGIELRGGVIFHTAVSPAGVGPTSSNKLEIEKSMEPLSKAGIRIHLGKGRIGDDTVRALEKYGSVYALMPPVTALLGARTGEIRTIAFSELGMEAFHMIEAYRFPAIIGAAHGRSIYDQ